METLLNSYLTLIDSRVARSDKFLELPDSAQALYFQLCMHADVEGGIMASDVTREVGKSEADLNALVESGFVTPLRYENGSVEIALITNWVLKMCETPSGEAIFKMTRNLQDSSVIYQYPDYWEEDQEPYPCEEAAE